MEKKPVLIPILGHIAGVPVEETLLSVGPALVAAVSVGLVHIRSFRDRAFDDGDAGSADDYEGQAEGDHHGAGDPVDPRATLDEDALCASCREDDSEYAVP